jgi:predicted secreted Zn-dependent protease
MRYFLILLLLVSVPAQAKIQQKTSYSYFKVSGNSAGEIYRSLLRHAHGPMGHDAFATTRADIRQRGNYVQGKMCHTDATSSLANFKIQLPQLTPITANAKVLNSWRNFSGFLKQHEEHHRSLWLACTANFNQVAKSLSAKSCHTLKSNYMTLWQTMLQNCKSQNQNFDQTDRAHLAQQPFIKLVTQGQ